MTGLLPPPRPKDLHAARSHLIPRYGTGIEQILWGNQTSRPGDTDLIRRVVEDSGPSEATSLAAALLLVAVAHRDLDLLELGLIEKVLAAGLTWEGIADVLALPDGQTMQDRYNTLRAFQRKQDNPQAADQPPEPIVAPTADIDST